MINILGIDPGTNGAIALWNDEGILQTWKMPDSYEGIAQLFRTRLKPAHITYALIENVHAWKGEGVHSVGVFLFNYGYLRGMLDAHRINYEKIEPRSWQKILDIEKRTQAPKTKNGKAAKDFAMPETKNEFKIRLMHKAQSLYPNHFSDIGKTESRQIADAILICHAAKMKYYSGK